MPRVPHGPAVPGPQENDTTCRLGAPELIIILVIALLILGPGKLPEVGASLGKTIREFRKASTDIQEAVNIDTSPLPSQQAPQAPSRRRSSRRSPRRPRSRRSSRPRPATRAGHGSEPPDDRDRRVGPAPNAIPRRRRLGRASRQPHG